MTREAVIVSTARTGIGKAYRGAFNDTEAPVLCGHVVKAAVERAGIAPAEVDDVIIGVAAQQGTQGYTLWPPQRLYQRPAGDRARHGARPHVLRLIAIADAAKSIIANERDIIVAGGMETISLVQNKHKNAFETPSQAVLAACPTAYMPMIETAEIVADRYNIGRSAQDEFALQSQQRTAEAQRAGKFADEIVPITVSKQLFDKEGNVTGSENVTLSKDEGNRADTTMESLAALKPVWKNGQWIKEGRHITAGNASQLSDGASVSVLMDRQMARDRGPQPSASIAGWQSPAASPTRWASAPCSPFRSCLPATI